MTTIEKLTKFVNARPGLSFADYGDIRAYRQEMAEITRDRSDYYELLSVAAMRIDDLENKLTYNLLQSSGRLTLKASGELEYCAGQYFPTEYRPAANRILAQLIWNSYTSEKEANSPNPLYPDGHAIRKALRRRVSRRIMRNYFN